MWFDSAIGNDIDNIIVGGSDSGQFSRFVCDKFECVDRGGFGAIFCRTWRLKQNYSASQSQERIGKLRTK